MQNAFVGHETDSRGVPSLTFSGPDQVPSCHSRASPYWSTAMQNALVEHDTEKMALPSLMSVGYDHPAADDPWTVCGAIAGRTGPLGAFDEPVDGWEVSGCRPGVAASDPGVERELAALPEGAAVAGAAKARRPTTRSEVAAAGTSRRPPRIRPLRLKSSNVSTSRALPSPCLG